MRTDHAPSITVASTAALLHLLLVANRLGHAALGNLQFRKPRKRAGPRARTTRCGWLRRLAFAMGCHVMLVVGLVVTWSMEN